ncbi:MAG: hypothetical protein E6593_05330 [Clostridium sp.]|nr:hypothetical protein [Clostridium sp.]
MGIFFIFICDEFFLSFAISHKRIALAKHSSLKFFSFGRNCFARLFAAFLRAASPRGKFIFCSFAPHAGAGTTFRNGAKGSKGSPKGTYGIRLGSKFWNATPKATGKTLQ